MRTLELILPLALLVLVFALLAGGYAKGRADGENSPVRVIGPEPMYRCWEVTPDE